jgi:hypothetical protein
LDKVREVLAERNAKHVVIITDTCHASKLITRGTMGISVTPYVELLKRERKVPMGWPWLLLLGAVGGVAVLAGGGAGGETDGGCGGGGETGEVTVSW